MALGLIAGSGVTDWLTSGATRRAGSAQVDPDHDVGAAGDLLVGDRLARCALVAARAADDVEVVEAQQRAVDGDVAVAVGLEAGQEGTAQVVADRCDLRVSL